VVGKEDEEDISAYIQHFVCHEKNMKWFNGLNQYSGSMSLDGTANGTIAVRWMLRSHINGATVLARVTRGTNARFEASAAKQPRPC
jgi:hypothetical protein